LTTGKMRGTRILSFIQTGQPRWASIAAILIFSGADHVIKSAPELRVRPSWTRGGSASARIRPPNRAYLSSRADHDEAGESDLYIRRGGAPLRPILSSSAGSTAQRRRRPKLHELVNFHRGLLVESHVSRGTRERANRSPVEAVAGRISTHCPGWNILL